MVKTYTSKKKKIIDALNEVDKFIEKMDLFMKEHPNYSYDLNIQKQRNNWEIRLTVTKDEQGRV